ncbi:MAG: dTDP-4-dehydrorhamnose reductase [Lysobacteraceae bacterium]
MSAATSSPLTRGHVLLVGADGQLGTELRRALAARGVTPMMSSLRGTVPDGARAHACDLSIPGALAALVREVAPSFVLNAAAYTAVDRAESEPDLARRLNAEAVSELGAVAKELGATVVHYSTDYVFAGDGTRPYREDDAPGPMSVYGRTKHEGEQALAASGADAVTFRLAWVYAAHSSNFLRTMLKVGAERDALRVVADQVGAPTPAHWIAEASLRALEAGARGLYHLAPQGQTSWHAYAEAIFAGAVARGLLARAPTVEAIPSSAYPTPAARPAWSVLDSGALQRDTGVRLPDWRAGLDEVLDQLAAAAT